MAYRDHDQQRQRHREYYANNRERILAQMRARRETHREVNKQYQREWYARNRERIRAYGAAYRHGMTPEDWAVLWDAQEGHCYLCGDELSSERTYVDHDHSCCPARKSCALCRRGLACSDCNSAIGYAHDDPARLRYMADALETAKAAFDQRRATASEQLMLPAG